MTLQHDHSLAVVGSSAGVEAPSRLHLMRSSVFWTELVTEVDPEDGSCWSLKFCQHIRTLDLCVCVCFSGTLCRTQNSPNTTSWPRRRGCFTCSSTPAGLPGTTTYVLHRCTVCTYCVYFVFETASISSSLAFRGRGRGRGASSTQEVAPGQLTEFKIKVPLNQKLSDL